MKQHFSMQHINVAILFKFSAFLAWVTCFCRESLSSCFCVCFRQILCIIIKSLKWCECRKWNYGQMINKSLWCRIIFHAIWFSASVFFLLLTVRKMKNCKIVHGDSGEIRLKWGDLRREIRRNVKISIYALYTQRARNCKSNSVWICQTQRNICSTEWSVNLLYQNRYSRKGL